MLSMHPEEYPPQKDFERISYKSLYSSSYVCDPAASLTISANADFSSALKCLALGKKSVEQLYPSKLQH